MRRVCRLAFSACPAQKTAKALRSERTQPLQIANAVVYVCESRQSSGVPTRAHLADDGDGASLRVELLVPGHAAG